MFSERPARRAPRDKFKVCKGTEALADSNLKRNTCEFQFSNVAIAWNGYSYLLFPGGSL